MKQIVELNDKGKTVAEIAKELDVSLSYVYGVLRAERPDRPRKKHRRTSDVPGKVARLINAGMKPAQIAKKLHVSRAYVYKCLPSQEDDSK